MSTFAQEVRPVTGARMWRAAHHASHGAGIIPGDFARVELPGPEATTSSNTISVSAPGDEKA